MANKHLSANTLFHFTPKIEYLKNMIVDGLYPRLCKEHVHGSDNFGYRAGDIFIPMICFCDIPLSQVSNHIDKYGGYALGLSKEWGLANSVAPVLYYHPNGPTFNALLRAMDVGEGDELEKRLLSLGCYFKPYEGLFHKTEKETRFYDEREWRFIPETSDDDELFVFGSDLDVDGRCEELNDKLVDYRLSFSPTDVRYVVISDEVETYDMIEYIQRHKKDFSFHDVQLLTTKIITKKQILEDF